MRRNILHLCIALFSLTIGLFAAGAADSLVPAVAASLVLFILAKAFPKKYLSLHYVTVALVTAIIWIPFAAVVLSLGQETEFVSCEMVVPNAVAARAPAPFTDPGVNCQQTLIDPTALPTVWAGVLDGKTRFRATVNYERKLDRPTVVPVSVLVNMSGEVVWAQSLSGPHDYRIPARDVACHARFYPTLIDGPSYLVNGILTFPFEAKRRART